MLLAERVRNDYGAGGKTAAKKANKKGPEISRLRADPTNADDTAEPGGGFMPDEEVAPGGFLVDDEAQAGGFLVDEEPEAGGFVIDEPADDSSSRPAPLARTATESKLQQPEPTKVAMDPSADSSQSASEEEKEIDDDVTPQTGTRARQIVTMADLAKQGGQRSARTPSKAASIKLTGKFQRKPRDRSDASEEDAAQADAASSPPAKRRRTTRQAAQPAAPAQAEPEPPRRRSRRSAAAQLGDKLSSSRAAEKELDRVIDDLL